MKKLHLPLAISLSTLLTAQVFSQEQDSNEYRDGYSLVLEQSWSEAQTYFSEFLEKWPESTWADDAAFWNCYSIEQSTPDQNGNFDCYRDFVATWPDSSWVADASSKLAVLGSNLAALGFPQYLNQVSATWDFDFDIDSDDISEAVERAMEQAEHELERFQHERERMREQGIEISAIPEMPEMPEIPEIELRDLRDSVRDIRNSTERVMRRFTREQRNSADDELLTVIAALRNNERASEILITRLESSTSPAMRSRIVMLLEDLEGESVTNVLIDVMKNDESSEVKADAVLVLLDRNEESVRDIFLELASDSSFPLVARIEIIDNMEDWDEDMAIEALTRLLSTESELAIIAEAANSLAGIGTQSATDALITAYERVQTDLARQEILFEISDIETPQVMTFLSNIALEPGDDHTAAFAIQSIADREDNIAVAALDHIYATSTSEQRRFAAIEGIGEAESQQAVDSLQQILSASLDPQIQSAVIRSLGDTDLESAITIILEAYRSSPSEEVKRSAIRALRRLDEFPAATDAMLEILENRLDEEGI